MKPVVDGLVTRYAGTYDIRVMNLSRGDAEAERAAKTYGVQYVPTFVFVNSDGSISQTLVGAVSLGQIEGELSKLE
ncbi:MAG TPA: thioredoxin family protein [Coriobacteriia bacterium]